MSGREIVSELIIKLLAEKITLKEFVQEFPAYNTDESLECAYHAVLHYDSDDEYRKNDIEYATEQINHLKHIADLLENNESLPVNMIEEYRQYYEKVPILSPKGFKNILKNLFKMII